MDLAGTGRGGGGVRLLMGRSCHPPSSRSPPGVDSRPGAANRDNARMPKSSTQTPPPSDGLIVEQDLPTEMRTSFLEYAYSVIYTRALPDARDGLKPRIFGDTWSP